MNKLLCAFLIVVAAVAIPIYASAQSDALLYERDYSQAAYVLWLMDELKDRDAATRFHAAELLGDEGLFGTLALPELRYRFENDPNGVVRQAAVDAYESLSAYSEGAAPVFEQMYKASNDEIRRKIIVALGEIGAKQDVVETILEGLGGWDRLTQVAAAKALGRIGPDAGKEAVLALTRLLEDTDDWWLRYSAAEALSLIGDNELVSEEALSMCLMDEDEDVQNEAKRALDSIGGDPVPHLVARLPWNPNSETSGYAAARVLAELGDAAVPALIDVLAEGDTMKVQSAFYAIKLLGADAKPALPILMELLKSDDPGMRSGAANAISGMGIAAREAVPNLIDALDDEEINVAMMAANALGGIAPSAREAIPALIEVVKSPEREILPTSPYYRLSTQMQSRPSLRRSAIRALGDIGMQAHEVVPLLIEVLRENDDSLSFSTSYALSQFGNDAVGPLVEELQNANGDLKHYILLPFVYMGTDAAGALDSIIAALDDDDPEVFRTAIVALRNMGKIAEAALPKLKEMLKAEDDPNVIEEIERAIDWIERDWTIEKERETKRPLCST